MIIIIINALSNPRHVLKPSKQIAYPVYYTVPYKFTYNQRQTTTLCSTPGAITALDCRILSLHKFGLLKGCMGQLYLQQINISEFPHVPEHSTSQLFEYQLD
ncbi:hypothetical protein GQX74_014447 [Glossina fuscipes]|nr:hypothetical protein GQX74_014447 [Glossina fuscipes]